MEERRRGNNNILYKKLLMQSYARTPTGVLSHYEITITFDGLTADGVILFFEHPIGCVATNQRRVSVWATCFGAKHGRRVLRRDWIGGPECRLVVRSQKGGRWPGVYPVVESDFSWYMKAFVVNTFAKGCCRRRILRKDSRAHTPAVLACQAGCCYKKGRLVLRTVSSEGSGVGAGFLWPALLRLLV